VFGFGFGKLGSRPQDFEGVRVPTEILSRIERNLGVKVKGFGVYGRRWRLGPGFRVQGSRPRSWVEGFEVQVSRQKCWV
jgi:hypothetical protein